VAAKEKESWMRGIVLPWVVAVMLAMTRVATATAPFAVGGDPIVVPGDYEVTTFASGLDYPFGLAVLQDGSLMAAINPGPSFWSASGEILRLEDADDDGVADGPGTTLYSSFPGFLVSLRRIEDLVFASVSVSGLASSIYILRQGPTPASSLTLEGSIDLTFPDFWNHSTFNLAVRDAPSQPSKYELYFNIGSDVNFAASSGTVSVSGLVSGAANPDSLYRVIVDDSGGSLVVANLLQIASGLRNAFGCAFDPATGDLYLQDNGIDGLVDVNEPLSADELNRIPAADIGGAVEDFGFPGRYTEYRTGNTIGAGGIDPVVAYQPVPPPNGAESEGPVDVVFAPPLFPVGLREGVFVGFHGRFSSGGVNNEENPLVYTDIGSGNHFHFIANTEPGIGHPNTLAATGDRLYLADMAASGGFSAPGTGSVYRIRYTKTPAVPALSEGSFITLAALLFLAGALMSAGRR
jgi:glucose/arabinose dehydrogenase